MKDIGVVWGSQNSDKRKQYRCKYCGKVATTREKMKEHFMIDKAGRLCRFKQIRKLE